MIILSSLLIIEYAPICKDLTIGEQAYINNWWPNTFISQCFNGNIELHYARRMG